MCFSPFTSFGIAGVLSIIGFKSIKEIPSRKFIPFAITPILFAIQQICEGILWVILLYNPESPWRIIIGFGFLFFAFIIWPCWIPLSLLLLEQKKKYKKTLGLLLCIGAIVSCYFLYHLLSHDFIVALREHHIYYAMTIPPYFYELTQIGYMASTVIPFFISSVPRMPFIGLLAALSAYVTYTVWYWYFISIWCFFAAILSVAVWYTIKQQKNK